MNELNLVLKPTHPTQMPPFLSSTESCQPSKTIKSCLQNSLSLTSRDNGRGLLVLDLAGAASASLDSFDNLHRLLVCNLAKDNVLSVEPRGGGGSDEELFED